MIDYFNYYVRTLRIYVNAFVDFQGYGFPIHHSAPARTKYKATCRLCVFIEIPGE
jgi:hypothetical protein